MIPLLGFVALDLYAKKSGKFRTTSRLLRENRVAALGLLAWGTYHIFLEEHTYEA